MTEDATQLQFYPTTCEAWNSMYEDCIGARESIEFEQYILEDDPIGHQFLMLFADKARQGLKVHLLLDRIGSRSLYDSPLIEEIRHYGGKVHFYNSIGWMNILLPMTWFPRNHSKTMLIDSKIAYVGSACIAEPMKNWRDTQVRVTGALVEDIQSGIARPKRFPLRRKKPAAAERPFRYLVNRPDTGPNPIYRELLLETHKAQRSIRLVTPYFLPPHRLRRALRRATRRGVEVLVIMGEKTDVPLADHVSHTYFPRFLRDKLQLLLYRETMLHAKYVIVDDVWATVGSTNIDYLSLLKNREANIITTDKGVIACLNAQFDIDRKACHEVDSSYWQRIPLRHKLLGYAGRIIKKIL